jgi:hypothetical protein
MDLTERVRGDVNEKRRKGRERKADAECRPRDQVLQRNMTDRTARDAAKSEKRATATNSPPPTLLHVGKSEIAFAPKETPPPRQKLM